MAEIQITSGRLKGDCCHYSFEEKTPNGAQSVDVTPDIIVHDDLRKAFRQLVPHLIYICDYTEVTPDLERAIDDIQEVEEETTMADLLTQFKVSGIKLIGFGEAQGVVITGEKRLINGKRLNLSTPQIKWEDEYQFVQELRVAVTNIQSEIIQYSEGKKAPDAPSLFDDQEDDYEESI